MALITEHIASLLQGMTQQDSRIRSMAAGDHQINGVTNPVEGLGKRNGTDHVRILPGVPATPPWSAWIARDEVEQYVALYSGGALRVYNLLGREFLVQVETDLNYLATDAPQKDITSLTLADSTIMLNRRQVPAMTSEITDEREEKAVVWVKRGDYAKTYYVRIAGSEYSTTTSDTDVTELATDAIALALVTDIGSGPGGAYTVTYTPGDSYFVVEKTNGDPFEIEVRDSLNGTGIGVCNGTANSFAELPPIAPDGFTARVLGSEDDSADDYWVVFDSDRSTGAGGEKLGQWVETVAPGTAYEIDPATMPHQLVRLQDDAAGTVTGTSYGIYFKFSPITWEDRTVGDTETNKNPSFIGNYIQNLFLEQNRLGFLFKSKVVLSAVGDFFNFFRTTVRQVLPDDRIDVTAAVGRLQDDSVLNLQHALNFNEQLLLIGNNAQVVLSSNGEGLSAATINIALASSLEADPLCPPVAVGPNALIPFSNGKWVGIREFYVEGSTRTKRDKLITQHVPRLLPGRPAYIAVCPSESTLVVRCTERTSILYIYRWQEVNGELVIASWGVWTLGHNVLSHEIIGTTIWALVARPEGATLESVDLAAWDSTTETAFPVLLDRKCPIGPANMISSSGWGDGGGGIGTGGGGGGDDGGGDGGGDGGDGGGDDGGGDDGGGGGGGGSGGDGTGAIIIDSGGFGGDGYDAGDVGDGYVIVPRGGVDTTLRSSDYDSRDRGLAEYNSSADQTVITMPYKLSSSFTLVRGDTMQEVAWSQVGTSQYAVKVSGDLTNVPLYGGFAYSFSYRFAPSQVYTKTGTGETAVHQNLDIRVMKWGVSFRGGPGFHFQVFRGGGRGTDFAYQTTRRVGRVTVPAPYQESPFHRSYSGNKAEVPIRAQARQFRIGIVANGWWPIWFINSWWTGFVTPQ